jgi:tetratricopeptide (TPR) repeat protein
MPDDVLKYVKLVRDYEKTSQEDKYKTGLYAGKAYLQRGDTTAAVKEFNYTVTNTKTIAAAEAKYNVANVEYLQGKYKASQKTCFDLVKDLPNYDYWVAKTYILLADNYVGLKDNFQAKATLNSIIDNYKGNDDILSIARQKMAQLDPKFKQEKPVEEKPADAQPAETAPAEQVKPATTEPATTPAAPAEPTKQENKEQ